MRFHFPAPSVMRFRMHISIYDASKIAVVRLDENFYPTDDIQYFTDFSAAASAITTGAADAYGLYIGKKSGVLSIPEGAFYNCQKIGIFSQGSVVSIGAGAFANAHNLKKINLSSGLLSIGDGAFRETAVESVEIPATVTQFGKGVIQCCSRLTSFTIPLCVTKMYSSEFLQCNALCEIIITENVREIGENALHTTPSLTEITIPATVETIEGTPLSGAFYMSSLQRIIINKPENSISGAPWGAVNAEIIWTGE